MIAYPEITIKNILTISSVVVPPFWADKNTLPGCYKRYNNNDDASQLCVSSRQTTKTIIMLKLSKYIHSIKDNNTDTWIYTNLLSNEYFEVNNKDHKSIDKLLSNPNFKTPQNENYLIGFKEILVKMKFIINSDVDEIQQLKTIWDKKKLNGDSINLGIVLTQNCNLRCVYCNQEHRSNNLKEEDIIKIKNYINKNRNLISNLNITWWGGEPLLKSQIINSLSHELISICNTSNINYSASISTNGILLNKTVCEILNKNSVKSIQITIDGPQNIHDLQRPLKNKESSYKKIITGIQNLVNEFNNEEKFITIRTNISKNSPKEVDEWNSYFDDLIPFNKNIKLAITPVISTFRYDKKNVLNNDEFTFLSQKLKYAARNKGFILVDESILANVGRPYCTAVTNSNWFISHKGRLTKCTMSFDDISEDCGKINQNGSINVFSKGKDWNNFSPFEHDECLNCKVLPICMGGCNVIPFDHHSGLRCHLKKTINSHILNDNRRTRFRNSSQNNL